jgi:hypothetical protein
LPLLAALPVDPDAVGRQVNFGQPCVSDPQSQYGRSVAQLAERLVRMRSNRQFELSTKNLPPVGEVLENKEDA